MNWIPNGKFENFKFNYLLEFNDKPEGMNNDFEV
jgi:hypothetical protein